MKTLSIISISIVLLFAGCKKEATTTAKTYLVSKITYNLTHVNGPTSTYVDTYTYDSQNRLVDRNSQYAGNIDFKYTYNDANQLVRVNASYADGSNYYIARYSYSGNMVIDTSVYLDGFNTTIYTITLNAKGQVQGYSNNLATSFACTYDSSGNIKVFDPGLVSDQIYTYDDKKNPLFMIGAQNIDLMYFEPIVPQTFVNNPLSSESGTVTYSYTYNSAGFPVTASMVDNDAMDPLTYKATFEYITK